MKELKNNTRFCSMISELNLYSRYSFLIKSYIIILTLFTLLITFNLVVNAQDLDLEFNHITSLNGLSHDSVYSVAQDMDGFMWFGTEDGLNKYDGNSMKVFQRVVFDKNTIQCSNCSALYVDSSNMIWIASWGGGVEVLDPRQGKIRSYTNNPSDSTSIGDNFVQSIYKDKSGTLWFGTYTKGLAKLDQSTGRFISYYHNSYDPDSISSNRVWSISEDTDGRLLVATDSGLDKLDQKTGKFTHYDKEIKKRVRYIYHDKNNTLWLGTQNGLCRFDTNTGDCETFYSGLKDPVTNTITSLFEDSRGNFWVGTSNGLNLFDTANGKFTRFENDKSNQNSLSANDIRAITEDLSGNVWITTRGGGINKLDIKPKKFENLKNIKNDSSSLSDNYVSSVFQDKSGDIWVGTKKGGLNKFNPQDKNFTQYLNDYDKLENRDLQAICDGDDNSIWVGSLGGLVHFNKSTGEVKIYKKIIEDLSSLSDDTVLSLYKDKSGTIWVGTLAGGLNEYVSSEDKFIRYLNVKNDPYSLSGNTVNSIYEDKNGVLWIATQNGLNKFDKSSKQFKRYNNNPDDPNSLSDDQVNCTFEDSHGDFWIGTQSGLNKFDRVKEIFKLYTIEDGLPNNVVHGIQEDGLNRLWLSTNKGLSVFDEKKEVFKNYDLFDGLQGNGYNDLACIKTNEGKFIFGGTTGMDYFNPVNVWNSTYKPPIVITNYRKLDKVMPLDGLLQGKSPIALTYKDITFSMEFSSLDFTKPEKNQYAYKLEGFDKDWNYIGTMRYLSYTNLPSGKYVLKIKGTNCDGLWNEDGISIPISVSPPPWQAWWANVIYAAMCFILIYFYIRFTSKKQRKKLEGQLHSLTIALSSTLDIQEVLKRFTESFKQIIPYDEAVFLIREADEYKAVTAVGSGEAENAGQVLSDIQIKNLVKKIKEARLPVIINEHDDYVERAANSKSLLGIPIIYNENIEGIVILIKKSLYMYTSKESNIGFAFAGQAGFALKNASLYEELRYALESLQEAHLKIVQSEKMVALGRLVAGIAHEINTPAGIAVTSASYLQDVTEEFTDQYSKNEITRSGLTRYLNTSVEACKIILLNLKRASELIKSFKLIAADQTNEEKRTLLVKEYIEHVLLSLKPKLKSLNHKIVIDCSNDLEITSFPGAIAQIVTNLLMNSVVHAYNEGDEGNIVMKFNRTGRNIVFFYSDDGKGISEENISKIFDPFYTTLKGMGGTGLGLNIVYNIVTQTLSGTIECKSNIGKGTEFSIVFPAE